MRSVLSQGEIETTCEVMMTGSRDLIGKGLELLVQGLRPFVEKTMQDVWGRDWIAEKQRRDTDRYGGGQRSYSLNDARFLLRVITEERDVFGKRLRPPGLSLASELRETGNTYSHDFGAGAFSDAATREALDRMMRLLTQAGAHVWAAAVSSLTAQVGADRRAGPGTAPPPNAPPWQSAPPNMGVPPRSGFGGAGPQAGRAPYAPPPPMPPWAPEPPPSGVGGKGFAKGLGISGGVLTGCLLAPAIVIILILVMLRS
ncbi:Swt1 family HEPN domain-containing protein [Actinomadura violacea]|uniref:Swt1-like HEPN domain-containing protein n=1 Tax=Actinomadura violacea TaxID=2819934 RepID=A0ABS3RQ00_9ACTN|nr:Swt1 family HEPN domain-containing protein [Actinomadura violacea]MBO2458139.1 hypothetical protein [Actinomadura violacea]